MISPHTYKKPPSLPLPLHVDYSSKQVLLDKLLKAGHYINKSCQTLLSKFELSLSHYQVLVVLKEHTNEPLSLIGVKNLMEDSGCDVSRAIVKLEKLNLVRETVVRSANKRGKYVTLTSKGANVLAQIEVLKKDLIKYLDNISIEEASKFLELLAKIDFDFAKEISK